MKVIIAILAIIVFGFFYGVYSDPNFVSDIRAAQVKQAEASKPADNTGLYVLGGVIAVFASLIFLGEITREENKSSIPVFVLIGGIALFLGVSFLFFYGDKNNDGVGDSQIVRVVQPTGNDAKNDLQYAEVNNQNSRANIFNATTILIFVIGLLLTAIVFSFVGFMLHRAGEY